MHESRDVRNSIFYAARPFLNTHTQNLSFKRFSWFVRQPPNGLRYPLVDGTRERHFNGIRSKPRKLPENAQTPTSRVHALLGGVLCQEG